MKNHIILIEEFLDQLSEAKSFILFDLSNVYYEIRLKESNE